MGIMLSDSGRTNLISPPRTARQRRSNAAYLSWVGPILISVIVAGWMLVRADAANSPSEPPARNAASTAGAWASEAGHAAPGRPASDRIAPTTREGHGSRVQESNIAPADTSGDEEGISNPPARAAQAVASVDGLTLLRQSLRRGGLGSKALMTLTIRNSNDYPVNHIQLLCSFRSQDGRYVTERRRLIDGVVRPNSRRTFRHMMVGFVSVNANRAKCSLLSADWA